MADIFLSYARADQDRIAPLVAALEGAGFSVWWDRDIETGASFSKTIERELTAATAIIVAWSDAASQSEWVRDEASFAHKHNKLFPIRLDASEPPLGFQQFQAIKFSKWRGDVAGEPLQHLLRDLRRGAGRDAEEIVSGAAKSKWALQKFIGFVRPPIAIGAVIGTFALIAGLAIFLSPPKKADPVTAAIEPPLVAVLPFKMIGAENEGALVAGLHSDILARISKLDAFDVISQTSIVEYAETTKNMRQIGEELGAGYVLEGSVQSIGDRVRINAQFIDTKSDRRLWSDTFDRSLKAEDLFAIQADLAKAIANNLNITLSDRDRAIINEIPTRNIDAYNAYLGGLALWNNRVGGVDEKRERVVLFKEAVRNDPAFASAWAHLAMAFTDLAEWEDGANNWMAARGAIEKARSLKPGLIEADIAQAYYLSVGPLEFEKALDVMEALDERSALSAEALNLKGNIHRALGQFKKAYESLVEAQQREPRNIRLTLDLIMLATTNDNCNDAAFHTQAALALAPDFDPVKSRAAFYEVSCTGNFQSAKSLLEGVEIKSGFSLWIARGTAMMSRDYQRAVELSRISNPENVPFGPISDQLYEAGVLVILAGDDAAAAAVLDKASVGLAALEKDPQTSGSVEAAQLYTWYSAIRRDAEETQYWIDERKRRIQALSPEDTVQSVDVGDIWNRALAGLDDEAIADFRTMLEQPGGRTFRFVDAHPAMDGLRNHPDYVALRDQYGVRR